MRTTAKPVVEKVQNHIIEYFQERALDEYAPQEKWRDFLNEQIHYMQHSGRTIYQTALDFVEGGSLLIYHTEVKEFLNDLGINPTGKEYSDDKSWRLYCHLVAREITKLVAVK